MNVNGMLKKSRYYPKLKAAQGMNIDYHPIDPNIIELDPFDSFKLAGNTKNAIEYVKLKSEQEKVEYTIVLYGELGLDAMYMKDYIFEQANKCDATYSALQLGHAVTTKRKHTGRVIYGHTHVANHRDYNCFSMKDLKFLLSKSLWSGDDEYAMLITKDGIFCIKYDIGREEFFRVKIS